MAKGFPSWSPSLLPLLLCPQRGVLSEGAGSCLLLSRPSLLHRILPTSPIGSFGACQHAVTCGEVALHKPPSSNPLNFLASCSGAPRTQLPAIPCTNPTSYLLLFCCLLCTEIPFPSPHSRQIFTLWQQVPCPPWMPTVIGFSDTQRLLRRHSVCIFAPDIERPLCSSSFHPEQEPWQSVHVARFSPSFQYQIPEKTSLHCSQLSLHPHLPANWLSADRLESGGTCARHILALLKGTNIVDQLMVQILVSLSPGFRSCLCCLQLGTGGQAYLPF